MSKSKKDEPVGITLTAKQMILAALDQPLLRGVPCLLGPSGGGKTFLAQEVHRERHPDGVLVTIIPAQESGDELGGIPLKPTKAGQTVLWSLPVAIPQALLDKGGTIFIDEMDKAAPDVWPVLLRLLAERMLRATVLPANVDIVCAANAPEIQLPDPLVSRLYWVRYPEPEDASMEHAELRNVPASVLARLSTKQAHAVSETAFPAIPPSRRAAHRLASWLRWGELWKATPESKARVLMGCLPQEMVPETLAALVEPIIDGLELAREWLSKCSPGEMDAKILDVLFALKPQDAMKMYPLLKEKADADKTGEFKLIVDRASSAEVFAAISATGADRLQPKVRQMWLEETKQAKVK